MSDEQLIDVANSMGIKKVNIADRDDVVYKILDQQAIDLAANATDRKRRQPKDAKAKTAKAAPKRKADESDSKDEQEKPKAKSVKKKAESASETPEKASDASAEQSNEPQKQPKKRGRKPKNDAVVDQPATAATVAVTEADEQPAQPDIQDESNEKKPSRRGRKKQQPEAETMAEQNVAGMDAPAVVKPEERPSAKSVDAANAEMPVNGNVEEKAENNVTAEPVNDNRPQQGQQQQRKNDFRPKDSSLTSFFPRSEGRKFVPRSQREKEEAAAAAAAAPITSLNLGNRNVRRSSSRRTAIKRIKAITITTTIIIIQTSSVPTCRNTISTVLCRPVAFLRLCRRDMGSCARATITI